MIHVIGKVNKIHSNDTNNTTNIDIEGYDRFVFDPTETTHGGPGFIEDSLCSREEITLNLILQVHTNLLLLKLFFLRKRILGCIYRHPNSKVPENCFIDNYIEPSLCIFCTLCASTL